MHIWFISEPKILLLESDGIIEEELWSASENIGDGTLGEVPMERARYIGEHEGGVAGQGFWEQVG